jgi:transcription initiation factor TFIIH subunit 1
MAPASTIQGAAAYKKKDGTLSIAKDQKSIQWLPVGARDNEKAVTVAVADIISMCKVQCSGSSTNPQ